MTEVNRFEVDAIDFQISCRRFTIRATITRDRQLPVVDEFVLRLLGILDRMPVARMRAWFGFSEAEIETVLVDMGRRALIELDGDDVALAPAGRDLFRAGPDSGVPHIVEVAPIIGDVWFDLVSRNMVPRSRSRNVGYLVGLQEQPSARDLPESFARQAFEENFRDYARRIRRFPDPDTVNLYSISDVEGGAYGYQVFPAGLSFDVDKMSVRPFFPELGEGAASFQKLTVAANDAWQGLSVPDSGMAASAEFERLTGDARLAALIGDPSSRVAWREAIGMEAVPGFKPTMGASYLEHNVAALGEVISSAREVRAAEILWLRPSGSAWGRSLRVAETLQGVREAMRNASVEEVHSALIMPRSTHKTVRSNHRRLFGYGALLPQGHLPPNLEITFISGVAALVNIHLPVGGHSVPLGGIVTDPKRLARIADRLKFGSVTGWDELWRPSVGARSGEPLAV